MNSYFKKDENSRSLLTFTIYTDMKAVSQKKWAWSKRECTAVRSDKNYLLWTEERSGLRRYMADQQV